MIYSQYKLYTNIKVSHNILTGFLPIFIIRNNKDSSCYILLFAYILTLFSLSPLPPSRFLTDDQSLLYCFMREPETMGKTGRLHVFSKTRGFFHFESKFFTNSPGCITIKLK